jgi:two-component system response regulator HydG
VKETTRITEVIVMTAYGTIESAVEAMRLGAYDYIQKPFTEQELLVKVERAIEKRSSPARWRCSRASSATATSSRTSSAARRRSARCSGASSEDRAHRRDGAHHGRERHGQGARRQGDPRQLPSARQALRDGELRGVTETLLESELFGHVRGAFTGAVQRAPGLFEEADGGTFFFDEIAETQPAFQAKLLRAHPGGRDPPRGRQQGR